MSEKCPTCARTTKLEAFWAACFEEHAFETEGIQELAVEAGLLVESKYDPEKHGTGPAEEYDMEPGDLIYVRAPDDPAAVAAAQAGKETA